MALGASGDVVASFEAPKGHAATIMAFDSMPQLHMHLTMILFITAESSVFQNP